MVRARALALVLVALAAATTWVCGQAGPALGWTARLALLFALPFAASVAASLILPREPVRQGASVKVLGTARFLPVVALALLCDLGAVGAGYALGLVTFTYGDQALEAHKLLAVPLALPFTIAASTLGTEWALRARLFEAPRLAGQGGEGALLSIAAGTALALPALAPGFEIADLAFFTAGVAIAALREATALALFRGGGLFVAGAWRGALVAIESFGLGDWNAFWFPMANYVTSDPRFYWLRVAGPLAAFALVATFAHRRAVRTA
jgi:hypothetical protein